MANKDFIVYFIEWYCAYYIAAVAGAGIYYHINTMLILVSKCFGVL